MKEWDLYQNSLLSTINIPNHEREVKRTFSVLEHRRLVHIEELMTVIKNILAYEKPPSNKISLGGFLI